jgi:hypothetical protein
VRQIAFPWQKSRLFYQSWRHNWKDGNLKEMEPSIGSVAPCPRTTPWWIVTEEIDCRALDLGLHLEWLVEELVVEEEVEGTVGPSVGHLLKVLETLLRNVPIQSVSSRMRCSKNGTELILAGV